MHYVGRAVALGFIAATAVGLAACGSATQTTTQTPLVVAAKPAVGTKPPIVKDVNGLICTYTTAGKILSCVPDAKTAVEGLPDTTGVPADPTTDETSVAPPTTDTPPPPATPKPQMTVGEKNALASAKRYLDIGGFSRKGLIGQLSSSAGEGFSKADSIYAADHAHANWNQQAVESAKRYLDIGGFSRSGLMEQLASSAGEGFTQAQASSAVDKVYR